MVERTTFIPGHARPKGSLDPQIVRGGGGRPTGRVRMQDTPQSKLWRRTMAKHVEALGWAQLDGPCAVQMIFWFDPASIAVESELIDIDDYPTHAHIGDLDKLVRNVLDALQDAHVYANDRQVVGFGHTAKRWARTHLGEVAGLGLAVWPVGRVAP